MSEAPITMEIWTARERHCGREIIVKRDPRSGLESGPAKCPECGWMPATWDLLAPAGAAGSIKRAATTAAIELAKIHKIDLATVSGTGKNGAILAADVLAAIAAKETAPGAGEDSEGGGDA